MRKWIVCLSVSFFFLFLFFVFSYIVKKNLLTQFDFNMTVRLQDHTPLRLDVVYPTFSFLASIESMSVILILILIFRRRIRGIIALLIFYASHAVELFGKVYIHHPPPPFMFYKHIDAASYAFEKSYVQAGSSYPSGHSFRTVFIAIIFAYTVWNIKKFPVWLKVVLICGAIGFVFLVCVSRVSLGEHWSSDVIGGALFGIGMGVFSLLFA